MLMTIDRARLSIFTLIMCIMLFHSQMSSAEVLRFEIAGTWRDTNRGEPCATGQTVCDLVGTAFTALVEFPTDGADEFPLDSDLAVYRFAATEATFVLDTARDEFDYRLDGDLLVRVANNRGIPRPTLPPFLDGFWAGIEINGFEVALWANIRRPFPPEVLSSDAIPTPSQIIQMDGLGISISSIPDFLAGVESTVDLAGFPGDPPTDLEVNISVIPVPASLPLLISAIGFLWCKLEKRHT